MKLSREVKTATLVILGIIFFVFGFNYLKGKNLLDTTKTLYAEYDNVEGLTPSTPVTINGLNVGKILRINFKDDNSGKLVVTMTVNTDFEFSKQSKAQIYENGLIGGKAIAIIPVYDSNNIAESGDFLIPEKKPGLSELVNQRLTPLQEKIEKMMVSADSLLVNFNSIFDEEAKNNLKGSIASLNTTMSNFKSSSISLNAILKENQSKLSTTLTNFENVSGNMDTFTKDLAEADVKKTIEELQGTLTKFDNVMASIENGEGSIGKLLKDEGLYNNLEGASKQMEELLQDMKLNPKRYVHFSLFGKKPKRYDAEGNEIKDKD
ncbi:MlaD family protein [Lacinutrix salivirga]